MGRKSLPPAGLRPLGGKLFFPWANFWRFFQRDPFFNPWDEEISIPETRPIQKSYIFMWMPKSTRNKSRAVFCTIFGWQKAIVKCSFLCSRFPEIQLNNFCKKCAKKITVKCQWISKAIQCSFANFSIVKLFNLAILFW